MLDIQSQKYWIEFYEKNFNGYSPLVSDRKERKKFNKYITYMVDKGGETICRFCKYQLSCSLRNETDCYRVVENKTCHDFLRIYTQGVTCQATDVALPLRGSRTRAIHCSRERERERVEKKKRNFRFKGAARDELFRKCRCYGGILRLTSSLFLFREEERIQARNLRFIGLEITMPTPCIILSSFFLLCDWNYFSFPFFLLLLPSLNCQPVVVSCFFFFFFSLHVSIMQLSAFHFQ